MFKVGDRVEWCKEGRFDLYGESDDRNLHDFGEVVQVDGKSTIWCKWEGFGSEDMLFVSYAKNTSIRKFVPKAPTRKNLKLELRVKGLELTVKVLEQDEVDTCKDAAGVLSFNSSDYFVIASDCAVEIAPFGELYIKGSKNGDTHTRKFDSDYKLDRYITRLKQAVKEFNAAGGFAKKVEETVEIVE